MKIIKPVTFTDAMLVSTTATEATAAYNAGTTYAKDAKVQYENNIYISLQASNLNKTPGAVGSENWWIKEKATNSRAMFDTSVSTQTEQASGDLVVVLDTGMINSIAFFNLYGTDLNVTCTDGAAGPEVFNRDYDLDGTIIDDWYSYFFEPYDQLTEVVITDIPPYASNRITITLSGGSGVKIGEVSWGTVYSLGTSQYGLSVGNQDYSVKEVDDYGNTYLLQRAFSRRMTASVLLENGSVNRVTKLLTDLRAVPCVYIGSEDTAHTPTIIYGYYKDFSTTIQYPNFSMCSIEIEGLS